MDGSIEHHAMEDTSIDDDSVSVPFDVIPCLEAACNFDSIKAAITTLDYVDISKYGI